MTACVARPVSRLESGRIFIGRRGPDTLVRPSFYTWCRRVVELHVEEKLDVLARDFRVSRSAGLRIL